MGHMTGTKSDLVYLIDRLNKFPIGLVDNPMLRKILELLYDETEAYVASKFPLEEASLIELCTETKMQSEQLLPILNRMADKGLVMDITYGKQTYYILMPGIIGFFEYTFMKQRSDISMSEVARLMTEYLHYDSDKGQVKENFGSKTQMWRSLVYDHHVPVSSSIVPYESAMEIINQSDYCAVQMCFCRHKKHHEGKICKKGAPFENMCISFGNAARFLVRRGFAERKNKAELHDVIQKARDLQLTHVTENVRNSPAFLCNCCYCCCEVMAGVHMGYTEGVAKTRFIAHIDSEKCDYCGKCANECNARAIGPVRNKNGNEADKKESMVKEPVCLGCGACIASCENGAISLELRENPSTPKAGELALYKSLLKEKGRLRHYVINRVRKGVRRIVPFVSM
ncbi:MAG: 4Fe-4S ferredoxin [Spirochaetota bacterium]|nr:MAG: 4Fe-4S ferredoxin [Spirochaetota bacterium]